MIFYVDEGGPIGGSGDVFTLAGWLAREDQWEKVESEWNACLGHRAFHSTDFKTRTNEFRDWPEYAQRRPLIESLTKSLDENVILGVLHSLFYEDFRAIFCPQFSQKRALRLAYGVLLVSCMGSIAGIAQQFLAQMPHGEMISLACENIRGVEGFATNVFHELKQIRDPDDHVGVLDRLGTIAFWPKKTFRGLQAADMLAYESFRHIKDTYVDETGASARDILMGLIKTGRLLAGFYDQNALRELALRIRALPFWPPKGL